ncbi:hypothetical protein [Planktothrix agardhii]|uniref:hypothetical protein n=1 Tax=Planktothrix agardhii TaxID=1160 RepID=UPI00142F2940|nr:hypothetical protein [Planktothrix agardhii]MCF3607205.1 hypothetical protein [Planktothrix agardhii 1033]MBG0747261.1 hypothetical protein [Planktothrix agardhii KL2]MCB8751375.1 hypothetical protein [Planktothrix agardhii 1810]MCB8760221.1 hypothetical protein [Planktothrix agardhii 1813]MCB8763992.1 hypothetical protein [Planktothrix agardhii 1809]
MAIPELLNLLYHQFPLYQCDHCRESDRSLKKSDRLHEYRILLKLLMVALHG